ncbi:MAG: cytochrome P450 [Bacteroidia bacterium]|nr:cytochrome P450 [Bacteroidia bacterium]
MKDSLFQDTFEEARKQKGIGQMNDQDDPIVMVLRHKDVRKCAFNWKGFKSEAKPGRIVVPSEVNIRDTRQIPFEIDPPNHTAYRKVLESWFKRPLQEEYKNSLSAIISELLDEQLKQEATEVISELSLPLQSKALTLLLNTSMEEAETWISWGVHVFRSEATALDKDKANILYDYIEKEIDRAIEKPGKDLYSVLLNTELEGRKLSREEVKGILVLTFAGGRDTVINFLTNSLSYFAEKPKMLDWLRKDPSIIGKATEELVRYFSPLTHIGRVSTSDTAVCGHEVKSDSRISLCWASANRDETVFENPNEVILDRKVNPHVAFGFSHHKCLGATHARQIMKEFLRILPRKVSKIEILEAEENIEEWGDFKRKVGFEKLNVKLYSQQG